jgi:hypothetical protein
MDYDTGIQTEHEGRTKQGPEAVYSPNPEERQAVELAKKLFQRARKHRSKYDGKWLDWYRMFRGKQWSDQRPSYRHSEVINLLFSNIQNQTALMTDTKPRLQFSPQDPSDAQFANILNDVASSDWERNGWIMSLCEVILDAHLYGVANSQVCYRQDLDNGQGCATYESIDPLECYPDPDAVQINDRSMDNKSSFFCRAYPVHIEKLKAKYPDKAKFIGADLDTVWNAERTNIDKKIVYRDVNSGQLMSGNSNRSFDAESNMTLKVEVWLKDDSIIEEMIKGELGETLYKSKKKYPRGRKIVYCGEVLLEDMENPYEDGEFPFQKHINYLLSREYYGISEVENLESPQKIFNKLVSGVLDVLVLMGNPVWIVPTSAGLDVDTITNRPGMILEPDNVNHGIQRQEGVQLQPFVMQLISTMQNWFDTVGGSMDITRGAKPTGVSAASAISQLQDAAQTRVRLKMRFMDVYLKQVGTHYLNRVMQFYDVQRVYAVTNDQDGSTKYFRFSIQKKDDGSKVARVIDYKKMGNAYEPLGMRQIPISAQAMFDVQIETGSSLPFAKADKEQRVYQLFDRGIIDAEEVMNSLQYPNAALVLDRMNQKAQAAAEAQQQQAQQGPIRS